MLAKKSHQNGNKMRLSATHLTHRLAYASPEISLTITFALTNSWYLFYLINVAGLSPLLGGLAFAVGRIFDAVSR